MKHTLSFEELDPMLGNQSPFLISLSDGLEEELRIIIAAADVGDAGGNISNFKGMDEVTKQALNGILAESRPIEINEKSKLLSHLSEITDAQQFDDGSFYPGRWTHYGIYTQNHVIDVISHCPPVVSRHIK